MSEYLSGLVLFSIDVASPSNQGSVGNVTFAKTFTIPTTRSPAKVPAISGPALRHTYSVHLARLAAARGLPVCDLCRRGLFLKHGDLDVMKSLGARPLIPGEVEGGIEVLRELERRIIEGCVVEDVTGFMVTGIKRKSESEKKKDGTVNQTVRRTSRILFSYALGIPGLSRVSPESRARHILGMEKGESDYSAQMVFHVQRVSGLFALAFVLHLAGVGRTSDEYGDPVELEDAEGRRAVAVEALRETLRNPILARSSEALPHAAFYRGLVIVGKRPLVPESPVALLTYWSGDPERAVEEAFRRTREAAGERGLEVRSIYSPEKIPIP